MKRNRKTLKRLDPESASAYTGAKIGVHIATAQKNVNRAMQNGARSLGTLAGNIRNGVKRGIGCAKLFATAVVEGYKAARN